jgi:hypothetical protein
MQIARSIVGEYERRLAAAGLSRPLPEGRGSVIPA